MNTTENNKIIAEFMIKQEPTENFCVGSIGQEVGVFTGIKTEYFKYEDLKFHSDWNWLMEVVEKIERLEDLERFEITNHSVNITYYQSKENKFILNLNHRNNGLYLMGGENTVNTKIQAVYNACLEFIKWYNEQII